jgi:multicomponent Na+:H+ antiporter subunit E
MGVARFGFRIALFALLWWILTEGAIHSWRVGVPVVVFAALASVRLLPRVHWSLSGILYFIPFFLWHSLRGGVDVARRALHPRLPISPGLIEYRWQLPTGLPRVFMANTVSLLPGTLSAELGEEFLHVHVLDRSGAFASELMVIEARVARLFGLKLATDRTAE